MIVIFSGSIGRMPGEAFRKARVTAAEELLALDLVAPRLFASAVG